MFPLTAKEKEIMQTALEAARAGLAAGEIPIGAAVLDENQRVIAVAHNEQVARKDSLAHAEMLVLREAMQIKNSRYLEGCTLAVTLEPCLMCAGAIAHTRVKKVIFGAWDQKSGACGSHYDVLRDQNLPYREVEVIGGALLAETEPLLKLFFDEKRR